MAPDAEPTASAVVVACEQAWADIQRHHPELPDAVMILGSGVERGRLVKGGHWWANQWVADGSSRAEVLLAGEMLHLEPRQVFEVLLHEGAHGINAARGIKDTSRGGRYHNERFATAAREVLLIVRALPPYGLAKTTLSPDAAERYAPAIDRIGQAMRIARRLGAVELTGKEGGRDAEGGNGGTSEGGRPGSDGRSKVTAAACGCGRKMRMAPSTLAAGPVTCGLCGTEFKSSAHRSAGQSEPGTANRRAAGWRLETVLRRAIAGEPDQPGRDRRPEAAGAEPQGVEL